MRCCVTSAALGVLSLASAHAAVAQSATVEEVVVTARKREESLQDVPIAVTSYTGGQMIRQGVRTPLDLGRSVPSLRALPQSAAASIVQFTMRGQSAGDVLTTVDQAVGVYVDGIYVARTRGLNAAFFDIDRIEVLKGPQGTLYGRNTTGGAISLITKGADYAGIHGYLGGDLGNHNLRAGRAAVNLPLVAEKLTLRLGYQGTFRDGFGRSRITGQDIGQDRNQNVFRGTLRFDPSSELSVQVKAEHYRSKEHGNLMTARYFNPAGLAVSEATVELGGRLGDPASTANAIAALNAIVAQGNADFTTTDTGEIQKDQARVTTLGATVTWDAAENVQIKSITGYRTFKTRAIFDLDATRFNVLELNLGQGGLPIYTGKPGTLSANFTFATPPEQNNSFFSQEFTLSGLTMSDRLSWLAGVYYSNESGSDEQFGRIVPALVPLVFSNNGDKVINRSWSLYTQDEFKISEKLSVTIGGRFTEEHKGLQASSRQFLPTTGVSICTTGVLGANGQPLTTTNPKAACRTRQEATFSGYSYLASLNYHLTAGVLAYVRTAKGFRGGAFQLRQPLLPPAGPETAKDIELGLKSELFARRLRANLAAYRTRYTNKQESTIIAQANGTSATIILNAANATLKGLEAELTARPVEGLTFGLTAAYFKGRYGSFPGALPIQSGAPVDASGELFPFPRWTYSLNGRYETPVLAGRLGVQADYAWSGRPRLAPRLVDPALPPAFVRSTIGLPGNGRDSLGLLDARIDYSMEESGLTIALFSTNILNKKYQYAGPDQANIGGIQTGITGETRMIGVTVHKTFGGE
jgi:iron complex outermembrane receptor protein